MFRELDPGSRVSSVAGLIPGSTHEFRVAARDREGKWLEGPSVVEVTDDRLPPDPRARAGRIDPTKATSMAEITRVLLEGPDAVQTGVEPGALDDHVRLAWVHGRVVDRRGQPVSRAVVHVAGHAELGSTVSREEGRFDLVVLGGGPIDLRFERSEFLPADRRVRPGWESTHSVGEVVLVALDTKPTRIDLTKADIQLVRATTATDAEGERTATMLVLPGTHALLRRKDGSALPATELTIRATEYTVGPRGPSAMPATLPPTSLYTYAVELSADEAIAADAEVELSQPAVFYVDNFLEFPVGTIVPVGTYDRVRRVWKAERDGVVLEILESARGLAGVDLDGDHRPDSNARLSGLGLTDAERATLADVYSPGTRVWRVLVPHMSPYDCNLGSAPTDSEPPPSKPPDRPGGGPRSGDPNEPKDCTTKGSVIGCYEQTLGESIAVVGTPFRLHYTSARAPGYLSTRSTRVALTDSDPSPSLKRIDVKIDVAGRAFEWTFAPTPLATHTFTWDGLDAFGRSVQGARALVQVSHAYDAVYGGLSELDAESASSSFGSFTKLEALRTRDGVEAVYSTSYVVALGTLDARAQGFGGWTLSPAHELSRLEGSLWRGDGARQRGASTVVEVLSSSGFTASNLLASGRAVAPAVLVQADPGFGFAVGPDGHFYVGSDVGYAHIDRVDRVGLIQNLVVNNDGQALPSIGDFALMPNGDVIALDPLNRMIRSISSDRTTKPLFSLPEEARAIAASPDGSILVVMASRIARIDPSGAITTVIERSALIADPTCIAVGGDGVVHAGAGTSLVRIETDGSMSSVAVTHTVRSIAVADDGTVYFHTDGVPRIGALLLDGTIQDVVGPGTFLASGVAAREFSVIPSRSLAVGPDGALYFAQSNGGRELVILRVGGPSLGGAVPARDGSESYSFDSAARHAATVDGRTGTQVMTLAYDSSGRLERLMDFDGNTTVIERNAEGMADAIVSPTGFRTTLSRDANGYLTSIENPAGEAVTLSHDAAGLLRSLEDAEGGRHVYGYDALGLLVSDVGPGGLESTSLTLTSSLSGLVIAKTSSSGDVTVFTGSRLTNGEYLQTYRDPAGALTTERFHPTGHREVNLPDGRSVLIESGSDARFGLSVSNFRRIFETDGLTSSDVTFSQTIDLASPLDPTRAALLTEEMNRDGHIFTRVWNADARTLTLTSPEGRVRQRDFDEAGRLTVARLALTPDPVRFSYGSRGELTETTRGTTAWKYGYDAGMRITSVSNALGETWNHSYDLAGRRTSIRSPLGHVHGFAYDRAGRAVEYRAPNGASHTILRGPDGAVTAYSPPSVAAYSFTRGADGRRVLSTLPSGRSTRTTYLPGGRIRERTSDDGVTVTYSYADATDRPTEIHRTTAVAGQDSTLRLTHAGKRLTRVETLGASSGVFTYGYSSDGALESMDFDGRTDAVAFDRDGLMISVGAMSLDRAGPQGTATVITVGSMAIVRTFDTSGKLIQKELSIGNVPKWSWQRMADASGRVVSESYSGVAGTSHRTFDYDLDGRLILVRDGAAALEAYAFDENGNRTARTLGGVAQNSTYSEADEILTAGASSFSVVDGFVGQRGGDSFAYANDGTLLEAQVGAEIVRYVYDGLERRVARRAGSAVLMYFYGDLRNPFLLTHVRDDAGTLSRLYYDDSDALVAIDRDGSWLFIGTDPRGSPIAVFDEAGTLLRAIEYSAFGEVISDSNPGLEVFLGFAGGIDDRTTGLLRFGYRDLDPRTGRWTARDPLLLGSDQRNLFAYVGNDPISRRDPLGLWCIGASAYVGLGLGVKLCQDDKGTAKCWEFGAGGGFDLEFALDEALPETAFKGKLELEGGCEIGGIGLSIGVECEQEVGCPGIECKTKGKIGPFEVDEQDGRKLHADGIPTDLKADCGVRGKAAYEKCRRL